jgi:hypothetical protein
MFTCIFIVFTSTLFLFFGSSKIFRFNIDEHTPLYYDEVSN